MPIQPLSTFLSLGPPGRSADARAALSRKPIALLPCLLGAALLPSAAFADMSTIDEQTAETVDLAEGFYEDVLVYRNLNNFDKYIRDIYVQHATAYGDGPAAMMGAVATELTADPGVEIDLYRTIAEGPYAAIHSVWTASDGAQYVYVDVWRAEDGLLVEHWDHYQTAPESGAAANEHTMYQGPDANIYDATQDVERNRERAVAVLGSLADPSDVSDVESYVSEDNFIQHDPDLPDGRPALLEDLASRADSEQAFELDVAKTIAMGDMVLVHSKRTDPGNADDLGTGFMDIFRFGPDGQIVEHWVLEEEQTGESANDNDPFGYPEG